MKDLKSIMIGSQRHEELAAAIRKHGVSDSSDAEAAGGPPVPSHHSPLFKISPEPAVRRGVESTIVALMMLMGD